MVQHPSQRLAQHKWTCRVCSIQILCLHSCGLCRVCCIGNTYCAVAAAGRLRTQKAYCDRLPAVEPGQQAVWRSHLGVPSIKSQLYVCTTKQCRQWQVGHCRAAAHTAVWLLGSIPSRQRWAAGPEGCCAGHGLSLSIGCMPEQLILKGHTWA